MTTVEVPAFHQAIRVVPPAPADPFNLGRHLIERHDINDMTVDNTDADSLRRMHDLLHRRHPLPGHIHHGRST